MKRRLTHDVEPGAGPDGPVVEPGPHLTLEDGVIAEADIVDLEAVFAGVVRAEDLVPRKPRQVPVVSCVRKKRATF